MFNRSAPIIKLPADATEDDHLALLGLLNSSTACFWMKQIFHNKGRRWNQHGARRRALENFVTSSPEHGCNDSPFPKPSRSPSLGSWTSSAEQICSPAARGACASWPDADPERLTEPARKPRQIRGQMIALQEELDWQCYQLYGLLPDDLRYTGDDLPELALGQRAFEIVMARQMAKGELKPHGSSGTARRRSPRSRPIGPPPIASWSNAASS